VDTGEQLDVDMCIASARADTIQGWLDLVASLCRDRYEARRRLALVEWELEHAMGSAAAAGASVRRISTVSGICKTTVAARVAARRGS
jgi:alkylhydroperoxidase family enzyme